MIPPEYINQARQRIAERAKEGDKVPEGYLRCEGVMHAIPPSIGKDYRSESERFKESAENQMPIKLIRGEEELRPENFGSELVVVVFKQRKPRRGIRVVRSDVPYEARGQGQRQTMAVRRVHEIADLTRIEYNISHGEDIEVRTPRGLEQRDVVFCERVSDPESQSPVYESLKELGRSIAS